MNQDDRDRGFEALLKPIRDCIAKDWQIRLCMYLDKFLEYIHENELINFSEAALVLQTTSTYYSKRVDLMYNWVRQFAFSLATNEHNSDNSDGPKRSHRKRLLASDGLACLGYSQPDEKINLKQEKVKKMEQVSLNLYLKTNIKPNSSCAVLQLNNEEMGYKEEFRLHWKLSNDGPLRDDFYIPFSNHVISAEMEHEEDLNEVELSDAADNVRGQLPDSSLVLNEVPPDDMIVDDGDDDHHADAHHHADTDVDEADITLEEVVDAQEKQRSTDDPFCMKIPFAALLIHRKVVPGLKEKLKKKFLTKQSECKGRGANKERNNENIKKEENINCYLSFSEILGGKKEDLIAYQLRMRRKQDRKIPKSTARSPSCDPVSEAPPDDISYHNDHFDSVHNTDSDVEDNEEGIAALEPSLNGDQPPPEPGRVYETNEQVVQVMTDFYKKMGDALQSAKTVAQWHSSIQDVIRSAEKNSIFDVHAYGTKIIEQFETMGETKPFSDIVAGQPRKEICRYLLSSLMLANTYNVELSKTIPGELSKDCLRLKLISTVRHHEELDANVAATTGPST